MSGFLALDSPAPYPSRFSDQEDRLTSTSQQEHPHADFVASRARADRDLITQRTRAVRTVAGQARDRDEFTGLLSMLGLDESPVLHEALAGYVHQVAAAVGVPAAATGFEVGDAATAHIGLANRWAGQQMSLRWDEWHGWQVGVTGTVLGHLDGGAVPTATAVAGFVADVVAGRHTDVAQVTPLPPDRATLAMSMATSRRPAPRPAVA